MYTTSINSYYFTIYYIINSNYYGCLSCLLFPDYALLFFPLRFCGILKGWWESLDFLDEDKMADKRMREAAMEASKMKDPSLMKEGEEPEIDDIFTDFLKEEKSKVIIISFH